MHAIIEMIPLLGPADRPIVTHPISLISLHARGKLTALTPIRRVSFSDPRYGQVRIANE